MRMTYLANCSDKDLVLRLGRLISPWDLCWLQAILLHTKVFREPCIKLELVLSVGCTKNINYISKNPQY